MDFQNKDIPGGQSMIVTSAAAGFPMAVAHCHLFGLRRRFKTAFKMLVTIEKEAHYHWSQFFLGVCYDKGYGTKKNYTKAVEWYSKSSEQKNPVAMNNLGTCYRRGEGVDKDKTKALELYKKSALLGYCRGMRRRIKDMNKAKEWYTKAAAHGDADAQTKLKNLKKKGKKK